MKKTYEGAEIKLSKARRKWRRDHEICAVEPLHFYHSQ
jgi:hypothetical protein